MTEEQSKKFTVDADTWVMTKKGEGPTFAEQLGLTPEQVKQLCQSSDEPEAVAPIGYSGRMMGTAVSRAALIGKAGEAIVAAELMRRGVSIAYPAYDGGIDLLAYREDDPGRTIPVQVKARSGSGYNFQRDWFKIPDIALVHVWNTMGTRIPECFIFSTLAQVEDALGQHVHSVSWVQKGGYNVTDPGKSDMALMEPHRDQWARIIDKLFP